MNRNETVIVLTTILEQKQKDLDAIQRTIDGLKIAIQEVENSEGRVVLKPAKGTYREEITNAMHDILEASGPLHRKIILEQLYARGIHVGGGIHTVGSYLSVDKKFKNIGKGIWALTDSFFTVGVPPVLESQELGTPVESRGSKEAGDEDGNPLMSIQ